MYDAPYIQDSRFVVRYCYMKVLFVYTKKNVYTNMRLLIKPRSSRHYEGEKIQNKI